MTANDVELFSRVQRCSAFIAGLFKISGDLQK